MKALIFDKPGDVSEVLNLKEISIPIPSKNEVLIKMQAMPFNPSDTFFINGNYRKKPVFPQIAGLEGAGYIEKIGSEVQSIKPGMKVIFRGTGTWAEYCIAKEHEVIILKSTISWADACQVPLNGLTAFALLHELALNKGDYLVLNAATSSLAYIITQLAIRKEIHIIALVNNISESNELVRLGVHVFEQDDILLKEKVAKLTLDKGIKGYLDAVGGTSVTSLMQLMAPYGKLIVYGRYGTQDTLLNNANLIYKNLTITGFGIDHWKEKNKNIISTAYNELIEELSRNNISFKESQIFPLNSFLELIQKKDMTKKIIIQPNLN